MAKHKLLTNAYHQGLNIKRNYIATKVPDDNPRRKARAYPTTRSHANGSGRTAMCPMAGPYSSRGATRSNSDGARC